ncbi:MAG: hypothetical protein O7G29_02340 [Acidobacteria bacterium]|nr:hypothetical protein [Acidobacteriota bacterium]
MVNNLCQAFTLLLAPLTSFVEMATTGGGHLHAIYILYGKHGAPEPQRGARK